MVEMPAVSQNDQLPILNDQSSRQLGPSVDQPPIAQTTKVPNTVRCGAQMTKSVKWVGCWIERRASVEPGSSRTGT